MNSRAAQRMAKAVLGLALLAVVGGCQSNGNPDSTFLGDLIGDISPPTPSQAARDAFNVYDPDARRRAVALLSASPFGGEAPYVRTYRLLMDDPDPTVRAACLAALGLHGGPEDVPLMTDHLTHPVNFVRWEAAKALQKVHDPRAVRPLLNALRNDEDLDVRLAAATALGQYRDAEVFGTLVGALSDRDYGVRQAAADSLATLTGQGFGVDAPAWLAWSQGQDQAQLFADARGYTWRPYDKPPGFWGRLQFWEKREPPDPRVPTGLDATGAGDATGPTDSAG